MAGMPRGRIVPIAAGGVDAEKDVHFLVADKPADYAAAILRILSDPAERRRLSLAGRERMLTHHTWERAMARLDGVIERCVTGFRRRRG